jgi:zinc transporter
LELVQVRARLVQEELVTQFSESTNRHLLFLSVVTSLLLPVTLITGIFGMNVGGLPFIDDSSGFGWTMFLMAITFAASVLVLRWRRLL